MVYVNIITIYSHQMLQLRLTHMLIKLLIITNGGEMTRDSTSQIQKKLLLPYSKRKMEMM